MRLADWEPLEEAQEDATEPAAPDRRGWYDPDAASYVELVERVVAIQRRRAPRPRAAADEMVRPERG